MAITPALMIGTDKGLAGHPGGLLHSQIIQDRRGDVEILGVFCNPSGEVAVGEMEKQWNAVIRTPGVGVIRVHDQDGLIHQPIALEYAHDSADIGVVFQHSVIEEFRHPIVVLRHAGRKRMPFWIKLGSMGVHEMHVHEERCVGRAQQRYQLVDALQIADLKLRVRIDGLDDFAVRIVHLADEEDVQDSIADALP